MEEKNILVAHPTAFSQADHIAEHIVKRGVAIVDLTKCGSEAPRVIDFLSGVAYVVQFTMVQILPGVYMFAPEGSVKGADSRVYSDTAGDFDF